MGLKKTVSIQQALRHVANNPELDTDNLLEVRVHELVCRSLFEIANGPDANSSRSLSRANTARALIFNRMVGKRRTGTHPVQRTKDTLVFRDLAGKEVEDGNE